MSSENRTDFQDAANDARDVINDREKTSRLAEEAQDKADRHRSILAPIRNDLDVLIRMARSWALGDYSTVPWKTLVLLMGAIIYFLNPIDVIPDFVFGLGFIDDIAVVQFVVRSIREDLDAFLAWEEAHAA